MGLLDRLKRTGGHRSRRARRAAGGRPAEPADVAHLDAFARSHRGVEGYVEPRTAISEVTLLLVAHDGEWTRRRVPSAEWAHRFANDHGVPSYDAAVVGYPQRMRDYNRRNKQT